MRLTLVALFAAALWLSACDEHQHDTHASHGKTASAEHGLSTNDGEKWPMDDHTRSMFATMTQKTAEADGDLKHLGKSLQGDLDKLIQGCTMTGAAHEELHKYLVSYMPAINKLSTSGKQDDLVRVRELLAVFPQYFK